MNKEENPPDGAAPPPTQSDAASIIIGIAPPLGDHPRVAIAAGGTVMAVADGSVVSAFQIERTERGAAATAMWRVDLCLDVRALVALPGARFLALADCEGNTRALVLDGEASGRAVATLPGAVVSALVAQGRLIAAMRRAEEAGSTLVEIDLTSGLRVAERRLASDRIDLAASPSGARIAIIDRQARAIELRSTSGQVPCPPTHGETPPAAPPAETVPPCPCRHPKEEPRPTAEDDERKRRERERERTGERPCVPGDAAVPDDRGGAVVGNGGRIDRRPPPGTREDDPLDSDCWGRLAWTADRLRWAGGYIVATQSNFMRKLAILDAADMRIVRERDFGRQGALVFASSDSEMVVVFRPGRGSFELVEPEDRRFVDKLDRGPIFELQPEEKTFVGSQLMSLSPDNIPGLGDINVLVLPVIEPGQSYNEPNFAKFWNLLAGAYFGPASFYYEENSFRQTHLHFHLFGHNRGPAGGPLVKPNS